MNKEVTMTKDEWFELIYAAKKLWSLEAGGVDNWEGYGKSMGSFWEEWDDSGVFECEDMARRIVACMKVCGGVSTESLESNELNLRDLMDENYD